MQSPRRPRLGWQAVSVLATGALLVLLRQLEPMFFLVNDKRNQYVPVARDIGRRLRNGEFPNIDPDLGTAGNYALDLQYGIYEPTHLLVAVGLSFGDDLALAGFLWALGYQLILALGTTCLALRLNASGVWAAAAGVAAATSGYVFYWLMPNWIPGLISIAWLPWLWWAWAGKLSGWRCLGIGLFSYLVIAGGWPATWLMFGALMVGLLCEALVMRQRSDVRAWLAPLAIRAVSAAGGLIAATVTVLPLLRASDYTTRNDKIENSNFLVGNLADMLAFASPALHGDLRTFGGQPMVMIPIYFVAWFALPVLWMITWRRSLVMQPGIVAGAVACCAMLALTQAPSNLGPLRDPIRSLAGAQFFFVVTVVVLACSSSLVLSRGRAFGMAASLTAVAWLTWARDPGAEGGLFAVLAVAAMVALFVGAVAVKGRDVGGATALGGSLLLAVLAFDLNPVAPLDRAHPSTLVAGRISFSAEDRPVLASFAQVKPNLLETYFSDGVGRGFTRLSPQVRLAPGYSSIRQRAFSERFCVQSSHGYTCDRSLSKMLMPAPTTQAPWIDLLGYRTLVIAGAHRNSAWQKQTKGVWRPVARGETFVKYERREPLDVVGRITEVQGEAQVSARAVSRDTQSYDVSSETGATLIFRDLFWPGYTATLNGDPLPVGSLNKLLVKVKLPPGSQGTLTLTYGPLGPGSIIGLTGGGAGLVALSATATLWWRRKRPGDHTDEETREVGSAALSNDERGHETGVLRQPE